MCIWFVLIILNYRDSKIKSRRKLVGVKVNVSSPYQYVLLYNKQVRCRGLYFTVLSIPNRNTCRMFLYSNGIPGISDIVWKLLLMWPRSLYSSASIKVCWFLTRRSLPQFGMDMLPFAVDGSSCTFLFMDSINLQLRLYNVEDDMKRLYHSWLFL